MSSCNCAKTWSFNLCCKFFGSIQLWENLVMLLGSRKKLQKVKIHVRRATFAQSDFGHTCRLWGVFTFEWSLQKYFQKFSKPCWWWVRSILSFLFLDGKPVVKGKKECKNTFSWIKTYQNCFSDWNFLWMHSCTTHNFSCEWNELIFNIVKLQNAKKNFLP